MEENPFGNSPVQVEAVPQSAAPGVTGLVGQGQAIQQMRDSRGFATAISVQQPRVLVDVERRVVAEAAKLGEKAFYSWPVKDKRTGRNKIVEGLTIGAAMSLLGEWGNSVIDSLPIQELSDAYIFTAACIDLERGVTAVRPFKLRKGRGVVSEKYDDDRAEETRFATAASKAARNAVLQLMPTWLTERMMSVAKEGVRAKLTAFIDRRGIAAAQDYAVAELAKYGVTPAAICEKQGRAEIPGLTIDDLIALRGDLAAIQDGVERPEALFPLAEGEKSTTDDLREQLTKKPDAAPAEPDNSKLKEAMDALKTGKGKTAAAPDDLAATRAAIVTAWGGIPEEDHSRVLANVQLMKVEAIDEITDLGVLNQIHGAFVDANRAQI